MKWWLLIPVISCVFVSYTGLNRCEAQEFIDFDKENRTLEAYVNIGFPPYVIKNIPNDPKKLYPKYQVIEKINNRNYKTNIKYNKCITNLTEAETLHLYEELHPDGANYKFNIATKTFEKCANKTKCNQIDCINGMINNFSNNNLETSENNVVCLAFKKTDQFEIIFQYQNTIQRCNDFNNLIDMRKLVVRTPGEKNVTIGEVQFLNFTTEENVVLNESFHLNKKHLCFNFTLCFDCELSVNLQCGEQATNEKLTVTNTTQIIYFDSSIINGWGEACLIRPTESSEKCKLEIKTYQNKSSQIDKFWFLTTKGYVMDLPTSSKGKSEETTAGGNVIPSQLDIGILTVILTTVLYFFT